MTIDDLYHPQDADAAYDGWGASCGPVALAAILKHPVEVIRPLLGDFEQRRGRYMNPTHLMQALKCAGAKAWRLDPSQRVTYGLLFLQWGGPWCDPGRPAVAAYPYTHWVGTAATQDHGVMVYDVNAWLNDAVRGAWVPKRWWHEEIRPRITENIARASGTYWVRWACQVEPR